jgi:hypothetical protein
MRMKNKVFAQTRKNTELILRSALESTGIADAVLENMGKNSSAIWILFADVSDYQEAQASSSFDAEMSQILSRAVDVCRSISLIKRKNKKEYVATKREYISEVLDDISESVAIQFVIENTSRQGGGKWAPSGPDCWNALAQLSSAQKALLGAKIDLSFCRLMNPITILGGSSPAAQRCSWEQTAVAAAEASVSAAKTNVSNMCGGWLF